MITLPEPLRQRRPTWPLTLSPPDELRDFAFVTKEGLIAAAPIKPITGVDTKAMTASAVISTIARDRMGDEVIPEGCDLTHYRRSPVVFFGHQMSTFPVGTSESPSGELSLIIVPGKEIRATCYFHQHTKEAMQVFDLVANGILRGVSIGFNPLSDPIPLPRDDRRGVALPNAPIHPRMFGGFRYERWELLEWSFVGVPANSQCGVVREVLSRDRLAGSRIAPRVRKSLELLAEPSCAWSNGFGTSGKKAAKHTRKLRSKSMDENTGTAGGFTLDESTKRIHADICNCVSKRCKEEDPHGFFYRPSEKRCWHKHDANCDSETLGQIKADLAAVDGIDEVTQSPEDPQRGKGWHKCYPKSEPWDEVETKEGDAPAESEPPVPALDEATKSITRGMAYGLLRLLPREQRFAARKHAEMLRMHGLTPQMAMVCACAKAMDAAQQDPAAQPPPALPGMAEPAQEKRPIVEAIGQMAEAAAVIIDLAGANKPDATPDIPGAKPGGVGTGDALDQLSPGHGADEEDDDFTLDDDEDEEFDFGLDDDEGSDEESEESEEEPSEEEESEDEDDEEGIEAILDRYRRPAPTKASTAQTKDAVVSVLKRLHKRGQSCIKEAADYLMDMAEMDHGSQYTRTHKAASRAHGSALHSLCKELEDAVARDPEQKPTELAATSGEEVQEGEVKSIVGEAMKEAMTPFHEAIYRITGQKVS